MIKKEVKGVASQLERIRSSCNVAKGGLDCRRNIMPISLWIKLFSHNTGY